MGGKPRRPALSTGLVSTIGAVAAVLDRHRGEAMVIGGIAAIARGVRRLTRDVDLSVAGHGGNAARWLDELAPRGIRARIPDAETFAAETQVLLLRHEETGVDVDLSFASLPFELEAIESAPVEDIAGARLAVARPEDLVIYKALAWRPQDQQDIERLLALHGDAMDLERVERHVRALGEALDVDRWHELEVLIRRVRGPDSAR
jgi:predicted nucleotidyltransferase